MREPSLVLANRGILLRNLASWPSWSCFMMDRMPSPPPTMMSPEGVRATATTPCCTSPLAGPELRNSFLSRLICNSRVLSSCCTIDGQACLMGLTFNAVEGHAGSCEHLSGTCSTHMSRKLQLHLGSCILAATCVRSQQVSASAASLQLTGMCERLLMIGS